MKVLRVLLEPKVSKAISDRKSAIKDIEAQIERIGDQSPEAMDAIKRMQQLNSQITAIRTGKMAVLSAVGIGTQIGMSYLRYRIGGIQYETGDSNYAAQVQETYSDAMKWVSVGTGIIGGIYAGATAAGPWGALVVGGAAAVGGGVSMGFQNAESRRAHSYAIWEDTVKVDYVRARQNINLYGGGRLR